MTTLDMLLAHYGATPAVPLSAVAGLWGMDPETLGRKIDAGQIRIPYFRLDKSQKAVRLVRIVDIAEHIDRSFQEAKTEFEKLWS